MPGWWGWCCCDTTACDLWFDSFDDADLSAYTEYAPSGEDPGFTSGTGDLTLTADEDEGNTGGLARIVNPVSGLSGLTLYCMTEVGEIGIPAIRAETLSAGCFLIHPHSDFDPSGGSELRLVWFPTGQRPDPDIGGWGKSRQGIILLTYPGASFASAIVHWGEFPSGARIRLEIHDISAGAGTYDVHCYVDNVLCHRACSVDLTIPDANAIPAGLVGLQGGLWKFICVGEDYLSQTRYCTHTPNQYNVKIFIDDLAAAAPGSPCFDIGSTGADFANLEAAPEDRYAEWWLRKLGFSGANTCVFDSYSRPEAWDEDLHADLPMWRLIVTDLGADTYDFRLEWRSTHTTDLNLLPVIVWELNGQTPYPTGNITLGLNAGESDCTITGLDEITLIIDECGVIGGDPVTDCCDDPIPNILPVRRAGLFPGTGNLVYAPLDNGSGGFWDSWSGAITGSECETTVTLVCKPCSGSSGAGCVDGPEGSIWHLSINGSEYRWISATCGPPFSAVVDLSDWNSLDEFVLGCSWLIIGDDDGSITDVDSLDVTYGFDPNTIGLPTFTDTRTLERTGCNAFAWSGTVSTPCGNKTIQISMTLDDEDTATLTIIVDGTTFFTNPASYTCDPFAATFPNAGATFCGEGGQGFASVAETP